MNEQLEFNLQEAIDNPAKAPEIVKAVQASFTELASASLSALETAKESKDVAVEYHKQVQLLTKSNIDMTETMKNIHIVLNSKKELWAGDEEMGALMDGLGTFVLSSGAIKMGVLNEAIENASK